ncbi:zinc-binding dehydrogenase [Nonomuraea ferruginea]|uniref:Zinc-binding dehydrogenase n=1 Tax=Nonomuraea ferruginea TaxID=46174 RepID=A0ABT4SPE0_9ACTN|nr:zinc-binding dehydrogenase [Nonomuraea ferruginea]MDA0639107.1 zinc-binding dehydrogenase [Nonomuraea ferruginea]
MRVVEVTTFGDPEVLVARDAPDPVAGPGQVLIEVVAVDVLFLDTQLRAGWGQGFFPVEPPYVPGDGVAGTVVAIGEGVDPGWTGRRVVARTGKPVHEGSPILAPVGGYATKAVARTETLVEIPDALGPHEALALLHDGPTGMGVVDRAGIRPGDPVLVTAAGGSLGVVITQLATAAGARVIGAARGHAKLDLARKAGAEEAVDYTEEGWADRVRDLTGGVQAVFDGAGGPLGRQALDAAVSGARFFAYGAAGGTFADFTAEEAAARGVRLIGITDGAPEPVRVRELIERSLAEAAAGRLRPHIGQTFPLERAADAHAAIAARTALGKTLLTCV